MSGQKFAIAVHGGAGVLDSKELSFDRQVAYRTGIREALESGHKILESGGSAIDAVQAAVRTLEDNPLFNAGRGAVLASDGRHYHDAAIMDGKDLSAGAVAGVQRVRNPIVLAREVMRGGRAILLALRQSTEWSSFEQQ
jgi:beta-aspartyl-peptidase (threonine type)